MMKFPTQWNNRIQVPKHQPAAVDLLFVILSTVHLQDSSSTVNLPAFLFGILLIRRSLLKELLFEYLLYYIDQRIKNNTKSN